MINLNTGEITLCNSKFLIHKFLTAEDVERNIPELIIKKHDYGIGNNSYSLWGDFQENQYVYFGLHFLDFHKLIEVSIYPQHHGSIMAPQPYPSDCNTDWMEVKEWYHQYFRQENERVKYPWGEIWFIRGGDSIYHPTQILIRYQ